MYKLRPGEEENIVRNNDYIRKPWRKSIGKGVSFIGIGIGVGIIGIGVSFQG